MSSSKTRQIFSVAAGIAFAVAARNGHAEMSATELAKLAQNPVGNLISVPFQNNSNLNYGPLKKTQNILNIQPVIPISLDKDGTAGGCRRPRLLRNVKEAGAARTARATCV